MRSVKLRAVDWFGILALVAFFSMSLSLAAFARNNAAELASDESVPAQPVDEAAIAVAVKEIKANLLTSVPEAIMLYDNGPLVNSPNSGVGGADESMLQTVTLGMNTLGFGHQFTVGNRMADDFEVTDGKWVLKQIHFFAYQTNAPTNSTMTGVYLQIWDGPPNDPNSKVVWGDLTTNRLASTSWAGIYRDSETTPGVANRPIMRNVVTVDTALPRGTYWLDWMTDGSASYSGPWAPPITITGQATTGNALQYVSAGSSWADALDSGIGTPQGMPFVIYGNPFSWIMMNPPITRGGVR